MAFEYILYEIQERRALITLNRPEKLNALNPRLWIELAQALQKADLNPEVDLMILTGKGKAFCAGDDIAVLANLDQAGGKDELVFESVFGLVSAIVRLGKPFITAVNGLAYGGGCEITLLSDLAVASDQAVFALPEGRVGVFPLICSVFGPPLLGFKASNELNLLGEPIDARRALELGLVNRVVPHDQLLDAAVEMARVVQKSSPASTRMIKQNSTKILQDYLRDFWIVCNRVWGETLNSEDFKEGAQAFTEKRPPRFTGR